MRLPYLQVTQETWSRARALSGALGIDRHRAMSLIVDLWAWALDLGPSDQPPNGELISQRASQMMAGALEWEHSKADDLALALEAVGLVELLGVGLRVKGMSRYDIAWTNAKGRSQKAKRAADARWHAPAMLDACSGDARAMLQDAKTQTQTHKKEEEKRSSFFAESQETKTNPSVKPSPVRRTTEYTSGHPPGDSLRDRMEAAWLVLIGTPYAWSGHDDLAIRPLLQRGNEQQILERWRRAILWSGFPTCASVVELAKHWNHYAKEQPKAVSKSGDRARV